MIKFNKPEPQPEQQSTQPAKIAFGQSKSTAVDVSAPQTHGPKNVFQRVVDPILEKTIEYAQSNYPEIFNKNEQRLRIMVNKLLPCELDVITVWGEDALAEQRELIKLASKRMAEFGELKGNELLDEVLDTSKKSTQAGLLQKFTHNFYKPQNYSNKIEALKIRVQGILVTIIECSKNVKDSSLPIWMAAISSVGENKKIDEDIVEQALLDRRRILQQATQNLQIVEAQLNQTKEMIVKMQSEIEHIINVVLPALVLSNN